MVKVCFQTLFLLLLTFGASPVFAQFNNLGYSDSTQILLVFENEQDTADINELKNQWQATELGTTPLTRIHLWQIPLDTVNAYGGPIGIQNHAIGRAKIKSEGLNFSVPLIINDDDDEYNENEANAPPCYPDSIFACNPGNFAVNVAFTDTGLDGFATGTNTVWQPNHPEFANRLWRNTGEVNKPLAVDNDKNGFLDDVKGWDFQQNDNFPQDENAHGTHTAGIAAGKFEFNDDNNRNKILVLKTHSPTGEASMWQLAQAIDYALRNNMKIINMSLAYLAPADTSGKPSVMEYLMEFAKVHRGTLFVAAAGNDALDIDQPLTLADGSPVLYCPANLPNDNLIVVGAGTCDNQLAYFSNFGASSVDLVAPGVDIFSPILSGNYGYFTGTSMAAPQVAAAAALAGSKTSIFNWKKIKSDILTKSTASAALEGLTVSGRMLAFCDEYPTGSPLLVTAAANKIHCLGSSTVLTASATGGTAPYTFAWSGGGTAASKTISAAGIYTVTATDNSGATATETIQIFNSSTPLADVPVDAIECDGTSTILEIQNTVAGAAYLWNTGAKTTSITVAPVQTTIYTVTTTLPTGCTSVSEITVPVLKLNLPAIPSQTICPCQTATLTAQPTGGVQPLEFLWTPGSAITPQITVSPTAASTTFTVQVSDAVGCLRTATTKVLVKCQTPTAASPVVNTQNQTLIFNWTPNCTANLWQIRWRCSPTAAWTTVNISNGAATSHTVSLPASCIPSWQIRGRCCNNKYSLWSSIVSARPAAGERSDFLENENLKIFPNPADEFLQLETGATASERRGQIFSSDGKLAQEFSLPADAERAEIFVGDLPAGVYFLKIGGEHLAFAKR